MTNDTKDIEKEVENIFKDTMFDDDYEVFRIMHKPLEKIYKICLALSGLKCYQSSFAVDVFTGKFLPESTALLLKKDVDQSKEKEAFENYMLDLYHKYRECMINSGIPSKNLLRPTFYGYTDYNYPQYKGKINEKPFFDYIRQLQKEKEEQENKNTKEDADVYTDISI